MMAVVVEVGIWSMMFRLDLTITARSTLAMMGITQAGNLFETMKTWINIFSVVAVLSLMIMKTKTNRHPARVLRFGVGYPTQRRYDRYLLVADDDYYYDKGSYRYCHYSNQILMLYIAHLLYHLYCHLPHHSHNSVQSWSLSYLVYCNYSCLYHQMTILLSCWSSSSQY